MLTPLARDEIIKCARTWTGTKYLLAGDSKQGIDCSHFVWRAYGEAKLTYSFVNTPLLAASASFEAALAPEKGDLVTWPGHVAIVVDPATGTFIGAQTSTGVAETSYLLNAYWKARPGRAFLRWRGTSR